MAGAAFAPAASADLLSPTDYTIYLNANSTYCATDKACAIDYEWTDAWVRGDNPQFAVWYTNQATGEKVNFQTISNPPHGNVIKRGTAQVTFPSEGIWVASSNAWDGLSGARTSILVTPSGKLTPAIKFDAAECTAGEDCSVSATFSEPTPFSGNNFTAEWRNAATDERAFADFTIKKGTPATGIYTPKSTIQFPSPGVWNAQLTNGFKSTYGSGASIDVKAGNLSPSAPTGVNVNADRANSQFAVHWTANSDTENVDKYLVRAKSTILGARESSCTVDAPATTCNVPSLGEGVPTYFRVVAHNGVSWGTSSEEVGPLVIAAPPSAPQVTAVSGYKSVTLNWLAPISDGGAEIVEYVVLNTAGAVIATVSSDVSTYTVTNAAASEMVAYSVRAINAQGVEGELGTSNNVKPFGEADASGVVINVVPSATAAVITWSGFKSPDAEIKSYTVESIPAGGTCTVIAPNSSCVMTGLQPSTDYRFTVVANNGADSAPAISDVFHTVPDPKWLEAPTVTEPRFNPSTNGVEFEITSNPVTIGVDVEYTAETNTGATGTVVCEKVISSICTVSFPELEIPTDGSTVIFIITPVVDGVTGDSTTVKPPRIADLEALTALQLIDTGWTCPGGQDLVGTSCRSYTGKIPVGSHDVTRETGRQTTPPCPAGWGPSWAQWPNGGTGGDVCVEVETYTVTDYGCPGGWNDAGGNCYQDTAATRTVGYKATFTPGWGEAALSQYGVAKMTVNGNPVSNGVSENLGPCPGDVTVRYYGYNGSAVVVKFACNTGDLVSKVNTYASTGPITTWVWDGSSSLEVSFKDKQSTGSYWVFKNGQGAIIGLSDKSGKLHVGDLAGNASGTMQDAKGVHYDQSNKQVASAKSFTYSTGAKQTGIFPGMQKPTAVTGIKVYPHLQGSAHVVEWSKPSNSTKTGQLSYRVASTDGLLNVVTSGAAMNLIIPPFIDPDKITVTPIGNMGSGPAAVSPTIVKQAGDAEPVCEDGWTLSTDGKECAKQETQPYAFGSRVDKTFSGIDRTCVRGFTWRGGCLKYAKWNPMKLIPVAEQGKWKLIVDQAYHANNRQTSPAWQYRFTQRLPLVGGDWQEDGKQWIRTITKPSEKAVITVS
jgi:hypothetical protein